MSAYLLISLTLFHISVSFFFRNMKLSTVLIAVTVWWLLFPASEGFDWPSGVEDWSWEKLKFRCNGMLDANTLDLNSCQGSLKICKFSAGRGSSTGSAPTCPTPVCPPCHNQQSSYSPSDSYRQLGFEPTMRDCPACPSCNCYDCADLLKGIPSSWSSELKEVTTPKVNPYSASSSDLRSLESSCVRSLEGLVAAQREKVTKDDLIDMFSDQESRLTHAAFGMIKVGDELRPVVEQFERRLDAKLLNLQGSLASGSNRNTCPPVISIGAIERAVRNIAEELKMCRSDQAFHYRQMETTRTPYVDYQHAKSDVTSPSVVLPSTMISQIQEDARLRSEVKLLDEKLQECETEAFKEKNEWAQIEGQLKEKSDSCSHKLAVAEARIVGLRASYDRCKNFISTDRCREMFGHFGNSSASTPINLMEFGSGVIPLLVIAVLEGIVAGLILVHLCCGWLCKGGKRGDDDDRRNDAVKVNPLAGDDPLPKKLSLRDLFPKKREQRKRGGFGIEEKQGNVPMDDLRLKEEERRRQEELRREEEAMRIEALRRSEAAGGPSTSNVTPAPGGVNPFEDVSLSD